MNQLDTKVVNGIRVLSADAIQKANSGHPGLPLGAAPAAYELWARHMNHNPADPKWINRDRFILSGGHGSALLYSLLYMFGYGLTIDDLKSFRQLDSLTPGHPEYGHTVGVEATTGPLGAGMGMAVGMAMAEAHLASTFNKVGFPVVDHYTFALGGDGCLMEGISSEAFSLAGTLGLGKLIILYDSNKISIEGSTDIAFTEDVAGRMKAFGFQVIDVADGNDLTAIGNAIEEAKADTEHPSFITIHTTIGYGCPEKQGKASAHGEPLGEENVIAMKKFLEWESEEPFYVPDEVVNYARGFGARGASAQSQWNELLEKYFESYPQMKELWNSYFNLDIKAAIDADPTFWEMTDKPTASRALSATMIEKLKGKVPALFGGSADLAPSNKTYMKDEGDFSKSNYSGRNIHFGVRELAMGAAANGLALHGGVRPYVGTFFVFSDYLKPMARLAALMKLPVTYVMTHDSIGVGEDGPTHEPIEQLAAFRAMPGFNVIRPADAQETAAAWYIAATSTDKPTMLVLTRQNLAPVLDDGKKALKGGYILKDSQKATPDAILIASGSEVGTAVKAAEQLLAEGIDCRVVSMPCTEIFDAQDEAYKESVLPKAIRKRVAVEALSTFGWDKYVGLDGKTVGMTTFGASAPYSQLFERFGITAEHVAEVVKSL